ncbi:MAG: HesA/MoeB/ThiF family protein [Pseudomonadota bacterium]
MNNEDLLRFNRHLLLPEIDIKGQELWFETHLVIVGCGGLGSVLALYATAAGIGKLTLIDHDQIELSNLQRQIAYNEKDIGQLKVDILKRECMARNASIKINTINAFATPKLLEAVIEKENLKYESNSLNKNNIMWMVDCSDNFDTRYMLNDFCIDYKLPLISGAATAMHGQVILLFPGQREKACYRCIFPIEKEEHPIATSCHEAGVFSPLVGVIACFQLAQLLKTIINPDNYQAYLWRVHAWQAEWNKSTVHYDKTCLCQHNN